MTRHPTGPQRRRPSDDRYLGSAVASPAGDGTLTYQYDPLGRITETKLDGLSNATYTYDRGSNRRTKTEGGQTFTYVHDRTDAIFSQKIGVGSALEFVYDSAGNVTTERTKGGVARTYAWDAADRLTKIDDPTGNDADLVYDPLDRVGTRTVGSNIQTFSYVGVTDDLWRQAGTTTSRGLLDADGARVGSKTGSTASWLLFDLLGSVAAAEGTSGTSITDALRYDAWGQTLGLYPATGSPLPTRFRGLVDLAPTADPDVAGPGSDPLYLMGARSYSPHTGAFTSLDTYAGSAIDPASLHRYLYAHANPTTLIDPDGHRICEFDPCETTPSPEVIEHEKDVAIGRVSGGGGGGGGTGQPTGTTTSNGQQQVPSSIPPLVVKASDTIRDVLAAAARLAGVPSPCDADDSAQECLEKSRLKNPCEILELPGSNQSPCRASFQLSDDALAELITDAGVGQTGGQACQTGFAGGKLLCLPALSVTQSGAGTVYLAKGGGKGKGAGGSANPAAGDLAVTSKIGDLIKAGELKDLIRKEISFLPDVLATGKRLKLDIVITTSRGGRFIAYEIKSGARTIFTANQKAAGFGPGKTVQLVGQFTGGRAKEARLPMGQKVTIVVFVEHR